MLSTYKEIVVTYFVLVNIQLGSKKLYWNDNELANPSLHCGKYLIFLANQIPVFLARFKTVLKTLPVDFSRRTWNMMRTKTDHEINVCVM